MRLKEIKNSKELVFSILAGITAFTYALMLSLRTMPFAEGWYTYYSQCINEGEVAYRDFDYLFPPFYLYLIAFFTKLFGYKIICLRIFGSVVFSSIAVCIYKSLKEFFERETALLATIPAVLYLQSEPVQIFYDYIRVMDVLVWLSLGFFIRSVKRVKGHEDHAWRNFFLSGFFCALVVLVKQSTGAILLAYSLLVVIVSSLLCYRPIKEGLKAMGIYLTGFSIPIFMTVLWMVVSESLLPFLSQTGSAAIAAKGGIQAILFGWIVNNYGRYIGGLPFLAVCITLYSSLYFLSKRYQEQKRYVYTAKVETYLPICFSLCCIAGFLLMTEYKALAVFLSERHLSTSPYWIFLVVSAVFIFYTYSIIKKLVARQEIGQSLILKLFLSGAHIAISWSCGMSGGLVEGQASIGYALMIALLLDNIRFRHSAMAKSIVVMALLMVALHYGAKKMTNTYCWWGMTDSDFWSSTECSRDIPLLDGLRISKNTLDAYEEIYHIVQEHSLHEDPIYCFSQIPVFYSLCDRRDPGTRAKVQWFDVVSDASIERDMSVIERNPPKVIIIYNSQELVYNSHERLFRDGTVSATRRMKDFLLDFAKRADYRMERIECSDQNNSFSVLIKE